MKNTLENVRSYSCPIPFHKKINLIHFRLQADMDAFYESSKKREYPNKLRQCNLTVAPIVEGI